MLRATPKENGEEALGQLSEKGVVGWGGNSNGKGGGVERALAHGNGSGGEGPNVGVPIVTESGVKIRGAVDALHGAARACTEYGGQG